MQDSAHDDSRIVGLVIVHDVLLDPRLAATGEEIIARLTNLRMSGKEVKRPIDQRHVGCRLLRAPNSPGVQKEIDHISIGFAR